jgi:hypothetical protein
MRLGRQFRALARLPTEHSAANPPSQIVLISLELRNIPNRRRFSGTSGQCI